MIKKSRIYINLDIFFSLIIFLIKTLFYKNHNKIIEKKFNYEISKYTNLKYIFDMSFCRSAFYFTLMSLKKGQKKEVLISPYALYPMINMIIYAGCKPIFIDFDKDKMELSLTKIKKKINKNTLAVLLTNYTGTNSNISFIYKFLKKRKIFLIEDCAIQFKKNLPVRSDFKLYSFNLTKNINAINGGIVGTNNKKLSELLKKKISKYKVIQRSFLVKKIIVAAFLKSLISDFIFNTLFFYIIKLGYLKNINSFFKFYRPDHNPTLKNQIPDYLKTRMTVSQKEIILKQLIKSDKSFNLRFEKAQIYFKELKNIKFLHIPYGKIIDSSFLDFIILCKDNKTKNILFKYLLNKGFETRYYSYRDCSSLNIYKKLKNGRFFNSKKIADTILLLPCHEQYPVKKIKEISKLIKNFSQSK